MKNFDRCPWCDSPVRYVFTAEPFRLGSMRGKGGERFDLSSPVMLILEASTAGGWVINAGRAVAQSKVALFTTKFRRHRCVGARA